MWMDRQREEIKKLEEEVKLRFIGNREAIHVLVLNLLHDKSTALIRGPRGRGKSTLMLLFLKGIFGDDFVVLSGSSEIKRGEVLARLDIPSLEREGMEKVIWSAFVKSPGKGLDEANRLNPYTAAGIYHLLQFGEVWAYGQRYIVGDFVLMANENPADPTTFVHPPPFYDRFDVSVYLESLTLSEKFELQRLVEKLGNVVEDMPQVTTFDSLKEIRKEVSSVELDLDMRGSINVLVRDLQACIRHRDLTQIKPPALCEGCPFIRNICSSVREGPSERAITVLTKLVKAKAWLDGKVDEQDIYRLALAVLPHRISLVRQGVEIFQLEKILNRQRELNIERRVRKQWYILERLYVKFTPDLYRLAREIAVEDLIFAEELVKLEEAWIRQGIIKQEEALKYKLR